MSPCGSLLMGMRSIWGTGVDLGPNVDLGLESKINLIFCFVLFCFFVSDLVFTLEDSHTT